MSSCTEAQSSGSAVASASIFDSFSSAFSSLFPTAHADDGDDEGEEKEEGEDSKEGGDDDEDKEEGGDEEEEDEDDEPEDPLPSIYEGEQYSLLYKDEKMLCTNPVTPLSPFTECENSKECAPAKHHFLECQERVESGNGFKDENCVEEFFHLAHCASECSAPRVFSKLQ